MTTSGREDLFDKWAKTYDKTSTEGFPRAGYAEVLAEIFRTSEPSPSMTILDIGIGTGTLALRFCESGCRVYGVDFSRKMLEKTRKKLPQVKLFRADLLGEWPSELRLNFERVVSAYVLHEFDLPTKIQIIRKLLDNYLVDGGRLVVGDVSFETSRDREEAHRQWRHRWDEDEYYWAADEAIRLWEQQDLRVEYTQVSFCGGVYRIESI